MRSGRRLILGSVAAAALLVGNAGPASAAPVIPDTATIRLTTKTGDLGEHPVLKWKAARDAASYVVIVQSRSGKPYWSWEGSDTSVRLGGGGDTALDDSEGASLQRPMVWFVIGRDDAGAIVASSAKRKLAP